ncbi:MAG: hypothetical protein KZQ93_15910 [Candidatus Thiodiazotropha sp. (ex Monitilora ramsayi)]|nr:hypothetical protein [Candidatus Thiodiazotropha sp. (ex Monitilora ramsayi)]
MNPHRQRLAGFLLPDQCNEPKASHPQQQPDIFGSFPGEGFYTGRKARDLFTDISRYRGFRFLSMVADMNDTPDSQLTQREAAAHLDMSERNLREVLKALKLEWKDKPSLETLRVAYIRHLRSVAGGRGGDRQEDLTDARTQEARVKAALGRLDYQERLGQIIEAKDAERALTEWAGLANREYSSGAEKLVIEIEQEHGISIDRAMVEKSVRATAGGIQRHAEKLSGALVVGCGEVQA